MNCSKTRLKLLDFIDGNLDQKNTANVEKHLSGCDVCRGFFTELQQFNILMHTEKKPNVNPFLSNRIVETMVLQSDTPSQLHRRHFSKLTAAAAIAVLVVAGIFGGLEIGNRITSGLSSSQADHPEISSLVNELNHEPLEQMLFNLNTPAQ